MEENSIGEQQVTIAFLYVIYFSPLKIGWLMFTGK